MNAAVLRSRLAGGAFLALLATVFVVEVVWSARHLDELRPVAEGDQAPAFSLARIDERGALGDREGLKDHLGEVVLIEFWATWCGPCRSSMPVVEKIHQRYHDRGLIVLSINAEGPSMAGEAAAMAAQLAPGATLLSGDEEVLETYKVKTFPHMVVVDAKGVVRWVQRGFRGKSSLEADLVRVLESVF